MQSIILRNTLSRLMSAAALAAIAVAACLVSMPAHAVSCEDVRNLSKAEQDYWSKQLNLSAEQRHQIWVACYQGYKQPKPEEIAHR
jgi:Spy/CpxP family protein refolding chaperone